MPAEPDDWFSTPFGDFALFGRMIEFQGRAVPPDELEALHADLFAQVPALEGKRDELREELIDLLNSGDARELLMQFALPYLFIDPNTWRESESTNLPAHVEYLALQVLSLAQPEDAFVAGEVDPRTMGPRLRRTEEIVRELFDIETHRLTIVTMLDPTSTLTRQEREARTRTLTETLIVRNNVYERHEREIATSLLRPLSGECLDVVGFTVDDALSCYDSLGELVYKPIFDRLDEARRETTKLEKEVKRYRRKNIEVPADLRPLVELTPTQLREHLRNTTAAFAFHGSRLHTRISAADLAAASGVDVTRVERFLAAFCATANEFDERFHQNPCPTHPLRLHPFLEDGDAYHVAVPGNILGSLVPVIEDALASEGTHWATYENHRSAFLEDETARLLGECLHGSSARTRLAWTTGSAEGELDVLVSYGEATIRAQCKSGRFTAPARRGGIERMRSDLQKLVGEAAKQHASLRDALAGTDEVPSGLEDVKDALTAPLQFEIVVLLEDLATFTTEAYKLHEFGTLTPDSPVPWIVSLGDLYVITDLLSNTGLVHFLTRREKLNRLGRVLAHDELDWLGHYLAEGLFFDEIFAGENAPDFYRLLSYTDPIDSWYFAKDGSRTVATEKPEQPQPPAIARLLRTLESRRPSGFVAAGCLLRDWNYESWARFNDDVVEANRRARRQGTASITMGFPRYGFCWLLELANPELIYAKAKALVRKDRGDAWNRPLWIAVGETARLGPVVAIEAIGSLASAYETAFLDPTTEVEPSSSGTALGTE